MWGQGPYSRAQQLSGYYRPSTGAGTTNLPGPCHVTKLQAAAWLRSKAQKSIWIQNNDIFDPGLVLAWVTRGTPRPSSPLRGGQPCSSAGDRADESGPTHWRAEPERGERRRPRRHGSQGGGTNAAVPINISPGEERHAQSLNSNDDSHKRTNKSGALHRRADLWRRRSRWKERKWPTIREDERIRALARLSRYADFRSVFISISALLQQLHF